MDNEDDFGCFGYLFSSEFNINIWIMKKDNNFRVMLSLKSKIYIKILRFKLKFTLTSS